MRKTPFLNPILTFVAAVTLASAAPAQTVTASIDASKTFAPINKLVYGQFLEHIGNLVNTGLWAEMLDDRKFFTAIPAPPPANEGGRFGRGALRRWTVVGPAGAITMDTKRPFVGKHSPRITLSADESRGIEQAGVGFVAGKEYLGRVVLSGDADARVTVSALCGDRPEDVRAVPIGKPGKDYKTFSLPLHRPPFRPVMPVSASLPRAAGRLPSERSL